MHTPCKVGLPIVGGPLCVPEANVECQRAIFGRTLPADKSADGIVCCVAGGECQVAVVVVRDTIPAQTAEEAAALRKVMVVLHE